MENKRMRNKHMFRMKVSLKGLNREVKQGVGL